MPSLSSYFYEITIVVLRLKGGHHSLLISFFYSFSYSGEARTIYPIIHILNYSFWFINRRLQTKAMNNLFTLHNYYNCSNFTFERGLVSTSCLLPHQLVPVQTRAWKVHARKYWPSSVYSHHLLLRQAEQQPPGGLRVERWGPGLGQRTVSRPRHLGGFFVITRHR